MNNFEENLTRVLVAPEDKILELLDEIIIECRKLIN